MYVSENWRRSDWAVVLLLGIVAGVFWLSAPTDGNFSWSDAPRHAMNGIFVLDLLRDLPLDDPKGWAEAYYIKYPALSILFYPPLFSLLLAGFYAVLGLSHATAQAAVAVGHFALMAAMYVIALRWLPRPYAFGAALVLGAAPEISLWGRQVMLDIPAYAWMLWSVVFLFRYIRTERTVDLLLTAALFLGCLYTKQTGIFALVPMGWLVVMSKGWPHLLRRQVVATAVVFVVALVPLVVMHLEFGAVNMASALGSGRDDFARSSVAAWTYYLTVMPQQLGWVVLVLAAVFLGGVATRQKWRMPWLDFGFLLLWFFSGYLFFSFIMVREPRHDLMALWPVVVLAMLGLYRLLSAFGKHVHSRVWAAAPAVLGLSTVAYALLAVAVPYVDGYREVVQEVMAKTPARSNILFNGYRDGNFVFGVRVAGRDDVGVVRADKLLLRLAIERERGVEVVDTDRAGLLDHLRRYRIRYVVSQPDFWTDLSSMRLLQEVLDDPELFRPIAMVDLVANYNSTDKRLGIYEYLGEIAEEAEPITLEMTGIGATFSE